MQKCYFIIYASNHDKFHWVVAVCLFVIIQPDNSQLHATFGSLLAAIDRYDSSIKAFEAAISVAKAQDDHATIGVRVTPNCANAAPKL